MEGEILGREAGELLVLPDLEGWARAAAERIATSLAQELAGGGRVSLALPGGNTPAPALARLADAKLDWTRVDVLLADERCVPRGDPRSNARLLREQFLAHFEGDAPELHEVDGVAERPREAAESYAHRFAGGPDVLVGGIGPDGHTASLFPGAEHEGTEWYKHVSHCPKPPPDRVTLTPRGHRAARHRIMLVRGGEKAGAVARALFGVWDPVACPAQWMRAGTWVLDEAAAKSCNDEEGRHE